MHLFTSSREKRLWFYTLIVLAAILSTLFIGRPVISILSDQNVQAVIFVIVMLLIGVTMVMHGLKLKPGKIEIAIWIGFASVYIMLFLRLGLAERSHLMEYSVLAIFMHMALLEREYKKEKSLKPALLAFLLTLLIGVLDECIQIFLPGRVFDPNDMLFNGIAAFMAIGVRVALQFIRKKMRATQN